MKTRNGLDWHATATDTTALLPDGLGKLPAHWAGPREPIEVPPDRPEDLPPGSPPEVPPGAPEELPQDVPTEVPPDSPPETREAAPHDSSKRRLAVLLVESDVLIRQSISDMLAELGHGVVEAGRAKEALDMLDARRIGLLMTSVNLPDASGVELVRRCRTRRPGLPVVFATGHGEIEGLEAAELVDSSRILAKPFERDSLSQSLQAAAGRGSGLDTAPDGASSLS